MNAWQAIVQALTAEGVEFVFGLPGNPRMLYDALYDVRDLKPVLVREESSGAFMAMGYARATGRPGVCFASPGPGMTNLLPGLLEAQASCTPIIALSVAAPDQLVGMPAFQEADQLALAKPVTKWCMRIPTAERTPWAVRRAVSLAMNGQPGPVYLEIAADESLREADIPDYVPAVYPLRTRGDTASLDRAADLIAASSRPVLVAGGGTVCSRAFREVREFVEELGIPVLTTASGRGIIPEDHPLALGSVGLYFTRVGRDTYAQADLLITVGSRNDQFETGDWSFKPPGARLLQVDIEPAEIGRNWIPDQVVVGDAALVLKDLLQRLRGRTSFHSRAEEIAGQMRDYVQEVHASCQTDQIPLSSRRVVHDLNQIFGPEAILVNENGSQDLWSYYSPYYRAGEGGVVVPGAQTCMGFGVAAAIGVKLAQPHRKVVCVTGDGAFQMFMKELPTAAQYRAGVTYVVLNNSMLGWIAYHQRELGDRFIATRFEVQPDFAGIARASGCYGTTIREPGEIRPALESALEVNSRGVPAVLDFIVDPWDLAPGFREYYQRLSGYRR